jgi:type IV pilus assembly protein PilV
MNATPDAVAGRVSPATRYRPASTAAGQRGFTLTEVLLAVMVLALGLLGLASLQLQSLRANQDAYHTSQASFLAEEILERMRGNPDEARAGQYDLPEGADGPAPVNCIGSGQNCTPQQLRDHDLSSWIAAVEERLPDGGAEIETAPGPAGRVRVAITLQWRNRGLPGGGGLPNEAITDFRFDALL